MSDVLAVTLLIASLSVVFIGLTAWAVLAIVEALNNIGAAVRGQVVKPVSIVPPSWGKRH